jgi:hypothetical protein
VKLFAREVYLLVRASEVAREGMAEMADRLMGAK